MSDLHAKQSSKHLSRRQFLSMATMTTAGTVLAACAPAGSPSASSTGGGDGGGDMIELIAWFTDRRSINVMTEEVAKPEFEEQNPGIIANVQFVPESEIQQKLLTSNAAGNAPDLSSIDETFLDTLTKNDILLPIPSEVVNVKDALGSLSADLYDIEDDNLSVA